MLEKLKGLYEEACRQIEGAQDSAGLDAIRVRVLGRKGSLTEILRTMGQLPAEDSWCNSLRAG